MSVDIGGALTLDVNVSIVATDTDSGAVVFREDRHNRVVDRGLDVIADAIAGVGTYSSDANVTHIGVGTGATVVAAGEVALVAEVFRSAVTQVSRSAHGAVFELFLTSTQANGSTLSEAGLFNGDIGDPSPNDAMVARVIHAPITKTDSVQVTYRWTIALSAA